MQLEEDAMDINRGEASGRRGQKERRQAGQCGVRRGQWQRKESRVERDREQQLERERNEQRPTS